jgi:hypothetical protein
MDDEAYGYTVAMTLVMDGVRRTQAMRSQASAMAMPMSAVAPLMPAIRPKERPALRRVHASTARANAGVRYITGMDGIRRAVPVIGPVTPREVLERVQAPAVAPGAASVFTEAPELELPGDGGIHWPSLRLPGFAWQSRRSRLGWWPRRWWRRR